MLKYLLYSQNDLIKPNNSLSAKRLFVGCFILIFLVLLFISCDPGDPGMDWNNSINYMDINASRSKYLDRVVIRWTSLNNAEMYHLYRSSDSTWSEETFEEIEQTTDLVFTDSTALQNVDYFYRVKAYNSQYGLTDLSYYDLGYYTSEIYTFQKKWGSQGDGSYKYYYPDKMIINNSSELLICDRANCKIKRYDLSGNYISQFGNEGSGNGEFDFPEGIAVDSSDNIYVADFGNNRIQKFDKNGNFLLKFGIAAYCIAVDKENNIYAAYQYNVKKYDPSGNFIFQIGGSGTLNGQFNNAVDMATDQSCDLFVVDSRNNRVQKFDKNGVYLSKNGDFDTPVGISIDEKDNVYVCDISMTKKFDKAFLFISKYGGEGLFWNLSDVAAFSDNLFIVINDDSLIYKYVISR
jgi:sugar lactone lactonase YvrE